MKHPVMIALSAAALLVVLVTFVAAPEFVKGNWFLFGVVLVVSVVRLISWLAASSEEAEAEQQVLAARQETERIAEATGQAAVSVWVYRTSSFIGRAAEIGILCDNKPAAILDNGSCYLCKVAPGPHVFSSPASSKPIHLSLEAGQEYFIRTGFTGIGKAAFEAVDKQQADAEMSKL